MGQVTPYIYGTFTHNQITEAVQTMHNDVHKLLLYKDNKVEDLIFENDKAFLLFFTNLMYKFSGTKILFNDNKYMVDLMSTLQAAYNEVVSGKFNFGKYRKAILNCHSYIKSMFEEGDAYAKFVDGKKNLKNVD